MEQANTETDRSKLEKEVNSAKSELARLNKTKAFFEEQIDILGQRPSGEERAVWQTYYMIEKEQGNKDLIKENRKRFLEAMRADAQEKAMAEKEQGNKDLMNDNNKKSLEAQRTEDKVEVMAQKEQTKNDLMNDKNKRYLDDNKDLIKANKKRLLEAQRPEAEDEANKTNK